MYRIPLNKEAIQKKLDYIEESVNSLERFGGIQKQNGSFLWRNNGKRIVRDYPEGAWRFSGFLQIRT